MPRETTKTKHLPVRVWRLLSWVSLVILTASPSTAQETGRTSMIVGANSAIREVARPEVVRIFMGQVTSWKDGTKIRPVDQSMTSPVRKDFSREVLRQSLLVVDNYWKQQIFAGRAAPPVVKQTDAAVVEFVSATPGAIGYVSEGYLLPSGVRALIIRE
jgi:ABC-type phosphate transport system substrate-binding protein